MHRVVVISYRCFGTSYRSHVQCQESSVPLKMGPIGCPETSVRNYNSLRNFVQVNKIIVHYLDLGLMMITEDKCVTFDYTLITNLMH